MTIGILTIDILIPFSASLKEKRRVLKSLKDKLRNTFNISIAEIDYHDKWQRSRLAIANINQSKRKVESQLDIIINFIDRSGKVQLVDSQKELL